MLKKIGRSVVNDLSKIFSYPQHKRTVQWMFGMGKILVPKQKHRNAFVNYHKPADHPAYIDKAERAGADMELQRKNWLVWMLTAWVGFAMAVFCAARGIILWDEYLILELQRMTQMAWVAAFIALWFWASVRAYQIQHQHLYGFAKFFITPTEWLPSPVFQPGWVEPAERETRGETEGRRSTR